MAVPEKDNQSRFQQSQVWQEMRRKGFTEAYLREVLGQTESDAAGNQQQDPGAIPGVAANQDMASPESTASSIDSFSALVGSVPTPPPSEGHNHPLPPALPESPTLPTIGPSFRLVATDQISQPQPANNATTQLSSARSGNENANIHGSQLQGNPNGTPGSRIYRYPLSRVDMGMVDIMEVSSTEITLASSLPSDSESDGGVVIEEEDEMKTPRNDCRSRGTRTFIESDEEMEDVFEDTNSPDPFVDTATFLTQTFPNQFQFGVLEDPFVTPPKPQGRRRPVLPATRPSVLVSQDPTLFSPSQSSERLLPPPFVLPANLEQRQRRPTSFSSRPSTRTSRTETNNRHDTRQHASESSSNMVGNTQQVSRQETNVSGSNTRGEHRAVRALDTPERTGWVGVDEYRTTRRTRYFDIWDDSLPASEQQHVLAQLDPSTDRGISSAALPGIIRGLVYRQTLRSPSPSLRRAARLRGYTEAEESFLEDMAEDVVQAYEELLALQDRESGALNDENQENIDPSPVLRDSPQTRSSDRRARRLRDRIIRGIERPDRDDDDDDSDAETVIANE